MQELPILLLIEDETSIRLALERLFRHLFVVTSTSSAEAALDIVARGLVPDVIISDYILPQMSGLDLFQVLAPRLENSMRVVLTGHSAAKELTQALHSNIVHRVFFKPWENEILLFQIQEVLKQRETLLQKIRLEHLSITDSVTGLFNHRYFEENLIRESLRAHRHSRPLSLILVDVDCFKNVNDQCGHPQGNEVLRTVAKLLLAGVRNIDTVCRYGGDEFAIILPDTSKWAARDIAERIRINCEKNLTTLGFSVTLSLGVGSLSLDSSQTGPFVESVDQALYQAKKNGKNQTVVADEGKLYLK